MNLQISKPEIVSSKDFIMPPIVYKYRDYKDDFHKRIITHREVYFSSPEKFDDKDDCRNSTRWDLLTYEEILNKYFNNSFIKNPSFTIEQHMEFAINWANNNLLTDKNFILQRQKEIFELFNVRAGVLSLTEYPSEIRMWEKYSNLHSGFCIGFDAKTMLLKIGSGGGAVLYHKELPQIYPSPKHSYIEQSLLQIFNKYEKWKFEKEYRAYIFSEAPLKHQDRVTVIPALAFKEIILGALMSPKQERSLIESIPDQLQHIKIKKAHLINSEIFIEDFN